MVLQTLAHPWRIPVHGNIQGPQLIPGPDARQQQQLRRLDGTGRNDDFAIHLDFPKPAPLQDIRAHGPAAFDDQAGGQRPSHNG